MATIKDPGQDFAYIIRDNTIDNKSFKTLIVQLKWIIKPQFLFKKHQLIKMDACRRTFSTKYIKNESDNGDGYSNMVILRRFHY